MRKSLCIVALVCAAIGAPTAHANTIDAIYAFGDSLSDVGNIYTATGGTMPTAPYAGGQFSNGNVWVQDLASGLGLPLTPSLAGGTDYAYGGAESAVTSFNTALAATNLLGPTGQIAQFDAAHPTANPNALYTIWIGSNDLLGVLASAPTPAQAATDLGIVAAHIDTAISLLVASGAKDFLILTVPDLGIIPEVQALGPTAVTEASTLSAEFDSTLVNGAGPIPSLSTVAAGDSVNISVLNTYPLIDSIVDNPSKYGFTNVTSPCYTGTYQGFADTADPGTVCGNPDQYFFWDSLHPTAAADVLVADAALATVTSTPEPSILLMLGTGLLALLMLAGSTKRVITSPSN